MYNSSFLKNIKSGSGWYHSHIAILTSCLLILIIYFYTYSVTSFMKVPIVIFQNGVTYNAFFENTYLISKNWDYLIVIGLTIAWLFLAIENKKAKTTILILYGSLAILTNLGIFSSFNFVMVFMALPLILSLLIVNKISKDKNILKRDANVLSLNYLAITVFISSIIGVILASSSALVSISPESSIIHNYTYPIYVLLSNISPVLIFLLIFSFAVKFLLKEIRTKKIGKEDVRDTNEAINNTSSKISKRTKSLLLFSFMILAVVITIIPHSPLVNPTNQQIGVDIDEYKNWITILMNTHTIEELINQVFVLQSSGDRPITLLFLLSIVNTTQMTNAFVIDYMPSLIAPLLILSIYFLTKELTSNDKASLIAAFITAVSFHTLIGIYAGLLANWLALVVAYLSIIFLFRYLKEKGNVNIFIYVILVTLSLFVHVYTWTIFTMVTYLFLLVALKMKLHSRKKLIQALLALSVTVIIDIARIAITGASSSGLQEAIYIANLGLNFNEFSQRWENLTFATQIYVGGIFSNFIVFALGLYWLVRSNLRESYNLFIVVFMSICIIPLFVGEEFIQARIFYDIPFQIPAAIALGYLMRSIAGNMMVFSICTWLLFVAIRTSFNFYLISPT